MNRHINICGMTDCSSSSKRFPASLYVREKLGMSHQMIAAAADCRSRLHASLRQSGEMVAAGAGAR